MGKAIRCPQCHQQFVLKIEQPTLVEEVAINRADVPSGKKRKRKTKAQMRRRLSTIKRAMRPFHARLNQLASQDRCSEEQVRVWCIDVLRSVLGYADDEIDTEMYALNQRIDIALKHEGKVFMVIECKHIGSKLSQNHVNQAVMYAANKSADWAVVTSGQVWKLIRVCPVKGADHRTVEVFDIGLLDADGVSDYDVECLSLLTSRALFQGETENMHHRVACLAKENVIESLMTGRVIRAMRRSLIDHYHEACDERVKLTEDEVEDELRALFLPPDLSDSSADREEEE